MPVQVHPALPRLPSHLVYKSLDHIVKEWMVETSSRTCLYTSAGMLIYCRVMLFALSYSKAPARSMMIYDKVRVQSGSDRVRKISSTGRTPNRTPQESCEPDPNRTGPKVRFGPVQVRTAIRTGPWHP
jgi:hypothetical protein